MEKTESRRHAAAKIAPVDTLLILIAKLDFNDRCLDQYLALRRNQYLIEKLLDSLVLTRCGSNRNDARFRNWTDCTPAPEPDGDGWPLGAD